MIKGSTLVITFLVIFFSLYHVKYHRVSRGFKDFEHLRLTYFNGGSAWDDSFLDSPEAFHKGRLNLNAWGGFHEVKLKKTYKDIGLKVAFEFFLSENSYIDFYLDRSHEERAFALRLSQNKLDPSIFFRRTGEGEFDVKIPLVDLSLKAGHNKVTFEYLENEVKWVLNDIDMKPLPLKSSEYVDGILLAWGGSHESTPIWIDNISIRDSDKKVLYENDFGLRFEMIQASDILIPFFFVAFLFLLSLKMKDQALFLTGSVSVNLLFTLGALLYFHFLSARYLEPVEDEITHSEVRDYLRMQYQKNYKRILSKEKKILVYGGSKTVGIGAREKEETWFERVQERF